MIRKFSCSNFRTVNVEKLELKKINLLVGPNNSGKTNFIRAISFFSNMLIKKDNGGLNSAFLNAVKRNGWDHMRYNHADDSAPISFSWDLNVDGVPLVYQLGFTVGQKIEDCHLILEDMQNGEETDGRYSNPFNYFSCHQEKVGKGTISSATKKGLRNSRRSFDVNSQETLMLQFQEVLLKDREMYSSALIRVEIAELLSKVRKYFENSQVYSTSKFVLDQIRNMADYKNIDKNLSENAGNFINVYSNRVTERMDYAALFLEKMRRLIPELKAIDVPLLYDKLLFRMAVGQDIYDLTDVSDGTLKALILNLLINAPTGEKYSLLTLDEPETNLHPAWQKVIGRWLLESPSYEQCIISTHSPDFLDCFTERFKRGEAQILVFDEAERDIRALQYEDIKDEMGDWELGDLYRTNDPAIGGWPW